MMLICGWGKGCKAPLYVVTNMETAEVACPFYAQRFRIEPCCSDQKSRGFPLHKSHLADPQRLSCLFMAAWLAYMWIVYLGAICMQDGWVRIIHRGQRCDLSLFKVELRLLTHFLNEELPLPIAFHIEI